MRSAQFLPLPGVTNSPVSLFRTSYTPGHMGATRMPSNRRLARHPRCPQNPGKSNLISNQWVTPTV